MCGRVVSGRVSGPRDHPSLQQTIITQAEPLAGKDETSRWFRGETGDLFGHVLPVKAVQVAFCQTVFCIFLRMAAT